MNATCPTSADAVDATAVDLQLGIRQHLDQLRDLLPLVHALVEGRQRGRGFLTHEGRLVLDRQVRAERRDRRRLARHPLGLKWLNSTTTIAGTGDTHDVATSRGLALEADIAFTLTDLIRRTAARRAATVLPRSNVLAALALPAEPTVTDLVDHLQRLVDLTPSVRALTTVAREIEPLVEQVRLAVHGRDRALLGEPCPHCGVNSLVRYLDEGRTVCEQDPASASKFPHPCVCPDPMCECKRNPRTFRHAWFDNPKDKTQRHVFDLEGLINHHKELAAMETLALDAVVRIRDLHQPIPIRRAADECPVKDDPDVDHIYDVGDAGEDLCWTCEPIDHACDHCTHDTDDDYTPHPCPTIAAIDQDGAVTLPAKGGRRG